MIIIFIITIITIIIIIIVVVVVVVDDDTYYWVYLSSDHTFQVYYKVRQVLLQNATGITQECDDYNTKCDRTNHISQPLLNGKRLSINENEFARVLVSRALIFLVVNKILTASPWTGLPRWTTHMDNP